MSDAPLFSESWHRIARERLSLRRDVNVRRQNYRGERWFVLEDPLANNFFRLRPEAWEFLARLTGGRSVEQAWVECAQAFPETAPGQQEVQNLLGQLYRSNLLHYDVAADARELFQRRQDREQRQLRSRLLGIMFLRLPLFDPDRLLRFLLPFFGWLVSPIGAGLWLLIVALGAKTVVDHWPAAVAQGAGVLAPQNLLLFYGALVLAKLLHELGHGFVCRKFGGEVHTLGVMLLIFTPVPYVDVTSSWAFRSRWQRILVGLAGMIFELVLAAGAALIWSRTGPGALNSVCYNIMFIASVSTLIFNINPLLRFDGYYILTDWLESPNLAARAAMHLKHVWKRWVWGLRRSVSPAVSRRESVWLTVFGIASGIYRVIVFGGVLLIVADQFLILGLLMAVACVVGWIIVPAGRLIGYLARSPELDRCRLRAMATTLGLAAGAVTFLQVVPWPRHFVAAGVVQAESFSQLATEAGGWVVQVPGHPGEPVRAGDPLVEMSNFEIDREVDRAAAAVGEIEARLRAARAEDPAGIEPLERRLAAARDHAAEISAQREALTVRARHDGRWSFLTASPLEGMWVPRGMPLGLVLEPGGHEFVAAVRQTEAGALFDGRLGAAEVRLRGQAGEVLSVASYAIVPGGRNVLPAISLGAKGGGDIPVRTDDKTGRMAAEPFYLVRARLADTAAATLLHGQQGRIRFRAGSEPLLPRWIRALRQLLQKRYQM